MELKRIPYRLTVCKVADISAVDMDSDFYFLGKTDEEKSYMYKYPFKEQMPIIPIFPRR